MIHINQDEFQKNLLLTQVYCDMKLNTEGKPAGEILRSINPVINGKAIFSFRRVRFFGNSEEETRVIWNIDPTKNGNEIIYDKLFQLQLVHKMQAVSILNSNEVYQGEIVVAEVDCVIVDGFSEKESLGIIDKHDCPPIDTWFYMARNNWGRILYAWIPRKFVPLVKAATEVNTLSTVVWLDEFIKDGRDKLLL
jgi:hypothetical protein